MHRINDFLAGIEIYLGGSDWFTLLLLSTGVFFTLYLKFPQIRFFKHSLKVVRGKYDNQGKEEMPVISRLYPLLFQEQWEQEILPVLLSQSILERASSTVLDVGYRFFRNDHKIR